MACVFTFTCNEVVQHCDAWCIEVVKITLAACCVIFVITKQYIIVSCLACLYKCTERAIAVPWHGHGRW